ncbi:MAG: hypothetical protein ACLGI6_09290 [Gammaproteobacteria bacterium]
MKAYPSWFLRTLLCVLLLVLVTGVLLAPTTLVMRFEMDVPWRLPGDARTWAAAGHAAVGFAMLMMLGFLWSVHMRSGWRRRKHRASGITVAVLLLLLAVSAVGVYYLGEETLGAAAAAVHLGVGLLAVLPFGWHWIAGRRSVRAQPHLHAVAHSEAQPQPQREIAARARRQQQGR